MPRPTRSRSSSHRPQPHSSLDTSWQKVGRWYSASVGEGGHYYHQHVVLPGTLRLLNVQPTSQVLDLACGQGVLARRLPEAAEYYGLDSAAQLISAAQRQNRNRHHHFVVADVTKPLPLHSTAFTHATIILALQNIQWPEQVFQNVGAHLIEGGRLVMVLNHPGFRIPRQSSWGIDDKNKTQYRRLDRYLTPLKVPITAHPGQKSSATTWSFHQPLSLYVQQLQAQGFMVETMEEWVSDKTSQGAAAKMENRSRTEFPLFLAISARKISLKEPGS